MASPQQFLDPSDFFHSRLLLICPGAHVSACAVEQGSRLSEEDVVKVMYRVPARIEDWILITPLSWTAVCALPMAAMTSSQLPSAGTNQEQVSHGRQKRERRSKPTNGSAGCVHRHLEVAGLEHGLDCGHLLGYRDGISANLMGEDRSAAG